MHQWYNYFDSDEGLFEEAKMDPYGSLIIGQMKMQELRQEAADYRQAVRPRRGRSGKLRSFAGRALIGWGERLLVRDHVLRGAQ